MSSNVPSPLCRPRISEWNLEQISLAAIRLGVVPTEAGPMTVLSNEYLLLLREVKRRIQAAQTRAALAVNCELIRLYWEIGKTLLQRRETEGWGGKVVARLASDLKDAFPTMKGLSSSNLKYMRYFAERCPDFKIGQQAADQFPWFHLVTLLTQVGDEGERSWLAARTIQEGWSRALLEENIRNRLFERTGQGVNNFSTRMPAPQAAVALEALKDPYLFDFLGLGDEALERDVESALTRHITKFLLELGSGFAFMARQYRLVVGGEEFFPDLLFYHTRLKCYVVVELKAVAFKPEHAGKLNFYLTAMDAQVKAPDDRPTLGLLLCRNKNRVVAEYSLAGIEKPLGISEYQLLRALPGPLDTTLPTIEALEEALRDGPEGADSEETG
jgi:predicted nuclease of restriction endonuclease-like (RecB) superfamily